MPLRKWRSVRSWFTFPGHLVVMLPEAHFLRCLAVLALLSAFAGAGLAGTTQLYVFPGLSLSSIFVASFEVFG